MHVLKSCRALGSRFPTPADAVPNPTCCHLDIASGRIPRVRSKLSAAARGFSKRTVQLYGRAREGSTAESPFARPSDAKNHVFSTGSFQVCDTPGTSHDMLCSGQTPLAISEHLAIRDTSPQGAQREPSHWVNGTPLGRREGECASVFTQNGRIQALCARMFTRACLRVHWPRTLGDIPLPSEHPEAFTPNVCARMFTVFG